MVWLFEASNEPVKLYTTMKKKFGVISDMHYSLRSAKCCVSSSANLILCSANLICFAAACDQQSALLSAVRPKVGVSFFPPPPQIASSTHTLQSISRAVEQACRADTTLLITNAVHIRNHIKFLLSYQKSISYFDTNTPS